MKKFEPVGRSKRVQYPADGILDCRRLYWTKFEPFQQIFVDFIGNGTLKSGCGLEISKYHLELKFLGSHHDHWRTPTSIHLSRGGSTFCNFFTLLQAKIQYSLLIYTKVFVFYSFKNLQIYSTWNKGREDDGHRLRAWSLGTAVRRVHLCCWIK